MWLVAGGALCQEATTLLSDIWERVEGAAVASSTRPKGVGMTCAAALEWPAEANGAANQLWWLIGTTSGELYLLNGDDLRPAPCPAISHEAATGARARRGPTGGVLLTASRADDRVGITALTVMSPDKEGGTGLVSDSALVVGFTDGCVRQYRILDLLTAS